LVLLMLGALALPAAASATFPGQNGKIAFMSERDEPNPSGCGFTCNWEIYSINPDGTGLTRLTNSPGFDGDPTWSPDGNKIAFASRRNGSDAIYTMFADGTGVTKLTTGDPCYPDERYPAWSPNMQKLAFVGGGNCDDELFTINADGTGRAGLTGSHQFVQSPDWSPDGSKIAFTDGDGCGALLRRRGLQQEQRQSVLVT
jgi:TolB protein